MVIGVLIIEVFTWILIRDISQLCKDVEDAVWWGAVAHQDDESSHWADFLSNSIKRS